MTANLNAFIDKAKESLVASKLLADNGLYDFAGSRAYYTMFYIAEAFLWKKGLSFSSHSAVISAFGREIAKPGLVPVELHRYLIDAQDKRTQGDYNIDDTNLSLDEVQILIQQSERFIALAERNLL
ncbi:HEPN domain-containing protein [Adonisia turfae]|uniref:HEPN domain-containing protein n=1 Tax=Adonisia turfae CCMR0081 TaxID=2292702 RepID=A0A6M0RKS6_9CYAN|nr:HEPN domain-containing protein [Adonisia turfae]NEZ56261.1 HEPN domain-containing protein [Adonisia turfae CCMR0081]